MRRARGPALFVLLLACAFIAIADEIARSWQPIAKDGLHDPRSPAVGVLQEPRDALSALAPDTVGNKVRWMEALVKGQIQPRSRASAAPPQQGELRETEIFMNLNGGTPIVRFPHKQHTLWLDCANCHDHLFKREVGASGIQMRRILQGEQCGLCHGAVSFPLTECNRCHNTSRIGFVAPRRPHAESPSALVPGTRP
jgi:c(7)-type cytochrome triheme protein